jgi:hypothetical protein
MGGSSQKSRPQVLELTEEDKILQSLAVDAAQLQNQAFGRNLDFSTFLQDQAQSFDFRNQEETLNRLLSGPTAGQQALIDAQSQSALGLLRADINEFTGEGLDQLRSSLAPTLGLRSTDSTILQRGSDIVGEGVDQFGRGATQIRGGAAQAALAASQQNAQLFQGLFDSQAGFAQLAGQAGLGLSAPSPIAATVETVKAPKVAGDISSRKGGGVLSSG